MKTNSHKTNNTIWLAAAISFALVFFIINQPTALAQQWTGPDGNGNLYKTNTNGNVGVGTTNPQAKLEVVNTAGGYTPANYLQVSGTSADNNNYPGISLKGGTLVDVYPSWSLGNGGLATIIRSGRHSSSYPVQMSISLNGSLNDATNPFINFNKFDGSTTTALMSVLGGGNVGIGTSSPVSKLQVSFSDTNASHNMVAFPLTLTNTATGVNGSYSWTGVNFQTARTNGSAYSAGTLAYDMDPGSATDGTTNNSRFHLRVVNAGNFNEALTVLNSGNVGIGTTGPNYKLDVQGGRVNASDGLCIAGDCKTNWSQIGGSQWANGSNFISYSGGNVGIGTPAPAAILDVKFTDSSTSHNAVAFPLVGNLSITAGAYTGINFQGVTSTGAKYSTGTLSYDYTPGAGILSSNFHLRVVSPSGNFNEALTVLSSGNVGIGVTNPTAALDVLGDIKVSGNINAKYQDVAEWVPASEQIPTGTVVVLDSTKSNQVIASTVSYDTRVAGVISERPGLALGERGDNKVLVATTGRVKVKVDASRAPIHIGDLLVTSDAPGVAMKSEPVNLGGRLMHMPGTLIGKALEPLEKGSGEILVLLSLQ